MLKKLVFTIALMLGIYTSSQPMNSITYALETLSANRTTIALAIGASLATHNMGCQSEAVLSVIAVEKIFIPLVLLMTPTQWHTFTQAALRAPIILALTCYAIILAITLYIDMEHYLKYNVGTVGKVLDSDLCHDITWDFSRIVRRFLSSDHDEDCTAPITDADLAKAQSLVHQYKTQCITSCYGNQCVLSKERMNLQEMESRLIFVRDNLAQCFSSLVDNFYFTLTCKDPHTCCSLLEAFNTLLDPYKTECLNCQNLISTLQSWFNRAQIC